SCVTDPNRPQSHVVQVGGFVLKTLIVSFSLAVLMASAASAQPFAGKYTSTTGANYLAVSTPGTTFDFTNGFTFEAWVSVHDGGACSSLAGKGYTTSWWVGICGNQLRSYLRGTASIYTVGTVPADKWTHVAVTWDGTTHKHYVDGELVGSRTETGAMTTSTNEMRIFSDTSWNFTPTGSIDEV